MSEKNESNHIKNIWAKYVSMNQENITNKIIERKQTRKLSKKCKNYPKTERFWFFGFGFSIKYISMFQTIPKKPERKSAWLRIYAIEKNREISVTKREVKLS